jgi:enoyl-CoA hydratase
MSPTTEESVSSMPSYKNLTVEMRGAVALVTVSREEKYNALNRETLGEIDDCFKRLQESVEVRAVVVTGAGEKAFISGADIGELAVLDAKGAQEISAYGQRVFDRIAGLSKPVIAAVNGFALGGGCELALACHIRIASDNAKLGLPEVSLGIIPGYGGTQRLVRLVGYGRAVELIVTAKPIDAAEADRIGLVNAVVPQAELLAHCMGMAERVAKNAPLAVAAALEAAMRGTDGPLAAGLRMESAYFGVIGSTEDMHEGLNAFLEKRKPTYRGK